MGHRGQTDDRADTRRCRPNWDKPRSWWTQRASPWSAASTSAGRRVAFSLPTWTTCWQRFEWFGQRFIASAAAAGGDVAMSTELMERASRSAAASSNAVAPDGGKPAMCGSAVAMAHPEALRCGGALGEGARDPVGEGFLNRVKWRNGPTSSCGSQSLHQYVDLKIVERCLSIPKHREPDAPGSG